MTSTTIKVPFTIDDLPNEEDSVDFYAEVEIDLYSSNGYNRSEHFGVPCSEKFTEAGADIEHFVVYRKDTGDLVDDKAVRRKAVIEIHRYIGDHKETLV